MTLFHSNKSVAFSIHLRPSKSLESPRQTLQSKASMILVSLLLCFAFFVSSTVAQSTCALSGSPLAFGGCAQNNNAIYNVTGSTSLSTYYCGSPFVVDPAAYPGGAYPQSFQLSFLRDTSGQYVAVGLYRWHSGWPVAFSAGADLLMSTESGHDVSHVHLRHQQPCARLVLPHLLPAIHIAVSPSAVEHRLILGVLYRVGACDRVHVQRHGAERRNAGHRYDGAERHVGVRCRPAVAAHAYQHVGRGEQTGVAERVLGQQQHVPVGVCVPDAGRPERRRLLQPVWHGSASCIRVVAG